MNYLALVYILIPIVLLIITKIKTDIKIYRVLLLSILPVILVSILISFYFFITDFKLLAAFTLFILIVIQGYILFFPFLIIAALIVKYLQKIGVDIISATFFASFIASIGISFIYNKLFDFEMVMTIFVSAFISVYIEHRLFQDKN